MVPIHNNGDSKRPKGISKAIEEYAQVHSNYTWEHMLQQREKVEMKTIGKAHEARREAYESLPI